MGNTNSFNYRGEVFLRFGQLTAVDLAPQATTGALRTPERPARPLSQQKVTRLDPAAVGKAVRRAAIPQANFTCRHYSVLNRDQVEAGAVGAPSGGNLERTAVLVYARSDGTEPPFRGAAAPVHKNPTMTGISTWGRDCLQESAC